MQAQKALQTITWIKHLFAPVESTLFGQLPEILPHLMARENSKHRTIAEELPGELRAAFLSTYYELGPIQEKLQNNPVAITVLNAFELGALHDAPYLRLNLGFAMGFESDLRQDKDAWPGVARRYREMLACVNPLTMLTIPADLQKKPEDSAHVLTIELKDRPELTSAEIVNVLKATGALYDSVLEIYKLKADSEPLAVLKIESGTGLIISFKGFADIIKEIKKLFIDIWNQHRHTGAEQIIIQNRAVSSSIDVLTRIESRIKKNSLTHEDGERLKRAVVHNTLSLFKHGALVTDIPYIELIDNRKLLDSFTSPRLLTAARDADTDQQLRVENQDGTAPLDVHTRPSGRRSKGARAKPITDKKDLRN